MPTPLFFFPHRAKHNMPSTRHHNSHGGSQDAITSAASTPPPTDGDSAAALRVDAARAAALQRKLVVGVIVFDGTTPMDFVGPLQYLDVLRDLWKTPIDVHTISQRVGALRSQTTAGMPFYATSSYADAAKAGLAIDVLLIPGGAPQYIEAVVADKDFLEYVRRAAENATYVLSVCTGARILAATGLLDGRQATTNKSLFGYVQHARPQVHWRDTARWVVDGKYWTSSGITAGMDMTWGFLQHAYGQQVADLIAVFLETNPARDAAHDPFTPTPQLQAQWSYMLTLLTAEAGS